MKEITIADNLGCAPIIVEEQAYEGVKRIAKKSAEDIRLVTGKCSKIYEKIPENANTVILYATIGKSLLLEQLEEKGQITAAGKGCREVYGICIIDHPWDKVEKALIVYGSDKRGTIYGIFHVSERMGVSPLIFWGDVKPNQRENLTFDVGIEMVSKEPSVRYRGFFINDEWPCFGNWTFQHFGGFTSEMYEHIFELLLRLKGNYLWPAMWSSSFSLDGPGRASAELADIYGVVMGTSHHEPCMRAGEEWDIYRGEHTSYGNEWNYVMNKQGLLEFWKDGLKRNGKYENIITIGMRGERDSAMQGPETMEGNIEILKDIISCQKALIEEYVEVNGKKTPKLFAIYKEVEKYFYGAESVSGLNGWEGLSDVILMLCEDNFGNMRALPDKEMRKHPGGYGMYYHLDYHGAPISYEWVNSTPLSKIWEQMTQAYEYGVREVWIVNVGDLKGNEFPLSYFMDLAYDFETWGTSAINSTEKYTLQWMDKQFGENLSEEQKRELAEILTECVYLNSLRRPEALNSQIYHPAHYNESNRMIERTSCLIDRAEGCKRALPAECQEGYYSMIYYPLISSMNLLLMQLYAGKNEHYAKQGKNVANRYEQFVTEAIARDRMISEAFGKALDGKWKGMELEKHIGFTKWNEDGCRYPLRMRVEPFEQPRMVVSRSDESRVVVKNYGEPEKLEIHEFLYPGTDCIEIEVANDGQGSFLCTVESEECTWLTTDWIEKEVEEQEILRIICKRDSLSEEEQIHKFRLCGADAVVEIVVHGRKMQIGHLPKKTFVGCNGVTVIKAKHFAALIGRESGKWNLLEPYGKVGCGLKTFPVTENFKIGEGPIAMYRMTAENPGIYNLEVWSAPSNPSVHGGRLFFGVGVNDGEVIAVSSVSEKYRAGEPENEEWSAGVLNQIHISRQKIRLKEGVNEIKIYAMDAGFVLQQLLIYEETKEVKTSYLGPEESFYTAER